MNKVLGKKTVFFASLFLLGFSFLADFILPVLNFHSLRGYLFWPVAISIVSMLIIQNGFSLPRFSVYSLWLVLILAVGFCIRFYRLGALPINHDEAHTTLRSVILLRNNYCVSYAQFPVSCFYGKIPSPFPLLVAVASRWLKSLEGIVRLPAVIFGTLTIWLVYRLVKEWLDKRTALLSAFLLAVFPWHIMQSRVGVEVILTPFCGALVFYLFSKAVKKQNVIYLYLSSVMVSIAAFWTYTASQVYLAVYVMCCLMLRKELSWVKLIDWINCALLFLVPFYPLLAVCGKTNFIGSRYYYSIFTGSNSQFLVFLNNAAARVRDSIQLLFSSRFPFCLFATGLKGQIVHPFLLPPLVFGFFHIRKNKVFARIMAVWLLAGLLFSVCFIKVVADRYLIALLPAIPVLTACGVFTGMKTQSRIYKKFRLLIAFMIIIGTAVGINNYFGHLYGLPVASLKAYSWGSRQVAEFLAGDRSFVESEKKAVIDFRMTPVEFYYTFYKEGGIFNLSDAFLEKFLRYWGGDILSSQAVRYYIVWSPESRSNDWDSLSCQLYDKFRKIYPGRSPQKIICYPDGRKAIEIFAME